MAVPYKRWWNAFTIPFGIPIVTQTEGERQIEEGGE